MADKDKNGGGTYVIDRPPVHDRKVKPVIGKPKMFRVLLHNDNTSPHTTVVKVLVEAFNKGASEANDIMRAAEAKDKAQVVITTLELAESRIAKAGAISTKLGAKDLTFSVEPE